MCGRITSRPNPHDVRGKLKHMNNPNYQPRYNVAPTQDIQVVREGSHGREMVNMRWGLIPHWSKDPKAGPLMINARVETIEEKPAYREAFQKRRCLIVADGYYEFLQEGAVKQPWYITLRNEEMFAFAGMWDEWKSKTAREAPIQSATIITTDANDALVSIHPRMPVILRTTDEYDAWLNPQANRDALFRMLRPLPSDSVKAYRVSRAVNNWRHDAPDCVVPLGESEASQLQLAI